MEKKRYYTTAEVAQMLGISRVAVFNKIKKQDIIAKKIGRNFAIRAAALEPLLGHSLSVTSKMQLNNAVARTVKEYGEALRLLGAE